MTVFGNAPWRRFVTTLAFSFVCFLATSLAATDAAQATPVFINEIHYDNDGTDVNEAIEVAGPAGVDLTDWSIVLYNGSSGLAYDTITLSGTLPSLQNGFGTLTFTPPGGGSIQNGSPDGLALVNAFGNVEQFLSYEGSFTAMDGPANGWLSVDIGVFEPSDTAAGASLQLIGTGTEYEDFTWASLPMESTFSAVNTGQTFVPEPSTSLLLGFGLAGLAAGRRRLS